ncbi:MAG: T9SS sorting signal type C domain-containing protein [Flavobacterium sp.]|nr:T9SS sorting signal type C domain-containing protein [Flavobacterium sp.]
MKNSLLRRVVLLQPLPTLSVLLLLFMTFISENSYAQPTVLGTQVANGGYVTYDLVTRGGGVRFVRINATSAAGAGARNWEFATGTAAATNYTTNWRPYTSGQQLSGFNTYIDPASAASSARYNTSSGGQSGTLPAIVSGSYYTFSVGGNSAANNFMSVLSTTYNPKDITGASQSPVAASVGVGQPVVVTTTISATLSTNETVYLRYSKDGFTTSTIIPFSTSGTTLTATIPGAVNTPSATISYYIFSSNTATAPSVAQADYFTLNLYNSSGQNVSGGGTNYSYTVGATTPSYTWNQTGTASWATGTNWTPTRSVIGAYDNMIFNNGATTTVTNIPVETVGGILVSGNTTVNLQPAGAGALTISNGVTGADLSVASGSALNANGASALALTLATGATGSVSGNMTFSGSANTFIVTDASALTFNSGSVITQGTSNTGNLFGSAGTANVVIFASGSTFNQIAGSNPFGLTQPASKITFQTGSLFKLSVANAPGLAGRTYANFQYDAAGTATGSGGTAVSIDNLTVSQGTLGINMTVASSIKGNISVASGATLSFAPSSAAAVNLNSGGVQTISNAGTITVAANANLTVVSGTTVDFGTSVITGAGTFTAASGSTLRTGNTGGIASSGATGSVQTTTRSFNAGANYVYNGTANQNTGTGLPATVNTLTINNTGTSPNNIVTLSAITAITATTSSLTLTAGKLDLNTKQLTIPTGGSIAATAGDFTATAGPVFFVGSGSVSGTVNFPTVTMAGGVDFGAASNIVTSLQLNSGAFISTNAPTYGSASTLIYNTTGTYGRYLEWSATTGKGYPNHVLVQNGTTVDLSANGFADRAIAGDLNLGVVGAASAGSLSMGATTNKLTVGGNVVIGGNTSGTSVLTLSSAIGGDIYLSGNWDTKTNGSYASNSRTVFFQGTGTSTVTTIGAATFDYLFVNKTSGGTVSLANDMTVNNNLTLNAQLVTNAFKVIIPTGNNVTANPNGWVRGNLQKNIPTGTNSRTFEIGNSTVYTPVTTAYSGVTGAGNLVVFTTDNDHPQISTSTLLATKTVNRYYNIANSGVTGGSYDATFTFVAGDLDSGVSTSALGIANYVNPTWTNLTIGARTSTTTQATGVTVYGDFQLGEGQTTWTAGASTTAWATSGNWSNGVPTALSNVIISSASFYPEITTTVSANSLDVAASTSLTVKSGGNLTLTDKINNAGTITVENNANLKQVNTTANTGSGSTVVKRNTAALMRQDYVMWSSPVSGQQLQAFSPNTLSTRFYTFDGSLGSAGQYVATSATGSFNAGIGYLIRLPNNHPVTPTSWSGTFTGGNAHNGPQGQSSLTAGRYYAVGNPYPSTIDADAFINDNSLTEAIYFWRKTNNAATSSYATYTLAGGVSNSGGDPLTLQPNGFIQVGQGFIARVPAGESTLEFTNTMRVINNADQFLRRSENRSRYWLNLTNNQGYFGQMMVAYMPNATNGYDPAIDGLYFNDSETALTSTIAGQDYIIQGRALPFEATDVVALGFKSELAGNFNIAINNFDGAIFDTNNQAIYLKDNLTNTVHDLRAGSYNFTTEAGVFNNRFEVRYDNFLSADNPSLTANTVAVYKQSQEIVVNAGSIKLSKVQIYDIRGRLLVEKNNIDGSEVRLNAGTTNQVVLVKVTSVNNEVVTKKVVN